MDIGQWLNGIGLGQYEALFREHEIDADVLIDLTEADLEKIGVPLGHRKRLMRAIAALSAGGTPPSAAKPAPAKPSSPPPMSGADAERRPITVMFCDLVGSTSSRGEAGRGGLAQSGRVLSRRGLGGGDGSRRPCAEKTRRRADGPVRLSAGAGERRRTRRSRGARHPARARRPQRAERAIRRARAFRAHRARVRLRSSSTPPAKCSAKRRTSRRGCRRRPNRGRCSSPRACSGRRPGFSSSRTRARIAQGRAGAGRALSHRAGERRRAARRGARL